jgi:hypothetical protein
MARGKAGKWAEAGVEPKLDEMIADPLVRVIMRHDGVSTKELLGMLEALRAQQREASGKSVPAGDATD